MEHESVSHIRNSRSDLSGVRHFSSSFLRELLYVATFFFFPFRQIPREKRIRLKDEDFMEIRSAHEKLVFFVIESCNENNYYTKLYKDHMYSFALFID